MTIGMGCFLGLAYMGVFIGALKYKDLRNEWSFIMLLGVLGLGTFAIAQFMIQLPWIIMAIGAASIPVSISLVILFRGLAPLFLPKHHYPVIEVEQRKRLPSLLKRLKE